MTRPGIPRTRRSCHWLIWLAGAASFYRVMTQPLRVSYFIEVPGEHVVLTRVHRQPLWLDLYEAIRSWRRETLEPRAL